ncbi:hypothetical protein ACFQ2C_17180 [Sphingobacterium daejeonense]|uniref:Uncharacterized protein n=1 Tax=Sphingobacterium daejeonense TaxID=371142 RepID=A0ABW3RQ17_9SPHI|nr:hypothetical protein [Sphingobacterium daejeonense]MCT1532235.1 hypothetical protein [Sphingobacterium daejeonense]
MAQEVMHGERFSKGKVSSPALGEISGIVSSINNPGMFWVHNDSGDEANIYLIDSVANLKTTYRLEGINAVDIEDIAWVEVEGKSYIVLADIGDNLATRANISLYIFPEPLYKSNQVNDTIPKNEINIKTLIYPGKARDAEAIFVDPMDKQFYLISKREFRSILYTAAIFETNKPHFVLKPLISFPFTFITAADISPRRDALIMKNLTSIYYWPLRNNMSISKALSETYLPVPYEPEPQGEAITFDRSSDGFFTISERPFGLDSYLYYYHISKP